MGAVTQCLVVEQIPCAQSVGDVPHFRACLVVPIKGELSNFCQDMYGISQKKSKYKAQWEKGVWVGKEFFLIKTF